MQQRLREATKRITGIRTQPKVGGGYNNEKREKNSREGQKKNDERRKAKFVFVLAGRVEGTINY